ncbi:RagB/SusD family nutrient uptake outer membrane protein [Mucilaginibacter psychrotolerans]|uniref:RagB/SusD family nutrient uptake outer membrane protein n=1 Tax=Mucilaginibacter psychrotolerans TaxID=1524096 RepID=A0A4Y8S2Y5_9SPHI|nr:RagB/SusD family nutrient uptake outer membrane protein [Mucilaginibacter psychrotolerans]TFF33342.1 RagB/SusD family nutrient uptake outer membrane protein [Mucilaginibacter psychrotolerans]
MKRIVIAAFATCILTFSLSCKKGFLDQVPDDRLTLDETFRNRNSAEKFLANVYSVIPDEASQRFPGSDNNIGEWTGGSDEAEYDWGFVATQNINNGTYDASSGFVSGFWTTYYRGIRSAGIFMDNVDKVSDLPNSLKVQYKAEARALRAMYYFWLMRIYGPVVITGDKTISPDASFDDVQLPRSSFDECVAYVTSELDAAMVDLPLKASNTNNYGRVNRAYAMAIKSQVLLYAASPLFNGNTDYSSMQNADGKKLISDQYDASKWKNAADAAKAFIDQFVPSQFDLYRVNDANGNYSPYLSTRDVMLVDWNKEIIYARIDAGITNRAYELAPYHSGYADEVRGSGGLGATQTMVDAYFMANGRSIDDPASGYVKTGFSDFQAPYDDKARRTYNQWANREPRFYVGITYNGSKWLNSNSGEVITETYNTANSGKQTGGNDYSPTGYIVRKNIVTGDWRQGGRSWVMLRLAEIYLNYAEALNEAEPGNADVLKYVNLIRNRAGVPEYGSADLPAPAGQDAMREAIRKERRVELAFENSRFFDTRRWKIAEVTDNGPFKALNISANLPEFYNLVTFENRVFNKRHYLYPIPQKDVDSDKQLVQNTGW